MNEKLKEILIITQEEAAEVIQEISKVFRFGLDTQHKSGSTHQEMLEQEIGDLFAMIDLLEQQGVITEAGVIAAMQRKVEKLKIWSNIYK